MNGRAGGERRGFTMIELIVAIVVSTIVLAASYMLLSNNQRFYRSQTQVVDVQQNIRAVAQILPSELREISGAGGDIQLMTDTALVIRAMRGFGVICDTSGLAGGRFTYRSSQWWAFRYIQPGRDNVLIFNDGVANMASDDQWVEGVVSSWASGTCPDATPGIVVQLSSAVGGFAGLATVTQGSPFRSAELVRYNLMPESGRYWLGVSSFASGAWTAPSAVAGPLRSRDGIAFSYFNAAGAVTTDSSQVAAIRVTVRGESSQAIQMQGRPTGTYADSLTVTVALRGN